ncbi:MAG: fused MFS/spermidine synthase [Antricoccus sp.]
MARRARSAVVSDDRRRYWLPRVQSEGLRFLRPNPQPGQYQINNATAQLAMDGDRDGGWLLTVDDVMMSYVALSDPTYLDFEYTRWIGDLLDSLATAGEPLRVLHLGAAACTLGVYVEATRPGSWQVLVEIDGALIDVVRQQFGVRSSRRFRLVHADAYDALCQSEAARFDVVIRDAFVGRSTPEHLQNSQLLEQVRRVLRPGGLYITNIGENPRMSLTRAELAAVRETFGEDDEAVDRMAFITDPSVLRGRRYGNVILAASEAPLPIAEWIAATSSRAWLPARVVHGPALKKYLS